MNITVDTNILVIAFIENEVDYLSLVYQIVQDDLHICHDHQGEIIKEYTRNLKSSKAFRKWYKRLNQNKTIYYCSSNMNKKFIKDLTALGCHEPSDHVFLGVAVNSDKILVTEDSDFGKGPKGDEIPHCKALEYLSNHLSIRVYDATEACEFLKLRRQ